VSSDIVERLRRIHGGSAVVEVTQEAADEIERLRAALRSAKALPHGCSTGFVPCWCES
jgi:hypothetical protein